MNAGISIIVSLVQFLLHLKCIAKVNKLIVNKLIVDSTVNNNMNGVIIISECLCYTIKATRRYDQTTVIQSLAKFYHDDELVDAKS